VGTCWQALCCGGAAPDCQTFRAICTAGAAQGRLTQGGGKDRGRGKPACATSMLPAPINS
jgi:hypothetical protein